MDKVVRFPGARKPYEEAAQWIARLDETRSDEDAERLRQWLHADSRNRTAFLKMAALWDGLDVLSELSALFPLEQPVPKRRRLTLRLAVACSMACLAAGAGFVAYTVHSRGAAAPALASNVDESFETGVGGHATEQLPDGSVLMLNTNTRIDVRYLSASRDVYLRRGEADFEVAHDAVHPFNVHVGDRIVQAVGTAFNIRLEPDSSIEVTVTEGKVRVTDAAEPPPAQGAAPARSGAQGPPDAAFDTTVLKGELAIFGDPKHLQQAPPKIVRLASADMDAKLAWQRGMLIFRGEPLEAMLAEVSRYTTTKFVLEDDSLRNIRVGGFFRAGDIDGLLLALHENFNIDAERVGSNRIVLSAAR